MAECERAEFLASLGADVAKLCDMCIEDDPQQTCFALKEIKSHGTVFEYEERRKARQQPKVFTFEVRTTVGYYSIRSPTYANASDTVREETREPVLSVRKCDE